MGYDTSYDLEVKEDKGSEELYLFDTTFKITFEEITGYSLNSIKSGVKWYYHEDDMKQISKKYPNCVFELSGSGDGRSDGEPDLWIKYFKNGKMQRCPAKITYDKYCEMDLK